VSSWANGVWRRVGNVLSMTASGTATAVKGEKNADASKYRYQAVFASLWGRSGQP
jgi:hypothetical protein